MKVLRFHHVLLFGFIMLIVIANLFVETVWTQRNVEYFPDMAASVPVDAQSAQWNSAMQQRSTNPAPGTRPFRQSSIFDMLPSEALPAADSVAQAWVSQSLPRGLDVYNVFCLPCHGSEGTGNGEVVKRGYPPPPSLLAEHALLLGNTEIYNIIAYGSGTMPMYRSQILPKDIWKVILHLRSLQKTAIPAGEAQ